MKKITVVSALTFLFFFLSSIVTLLLQKIPFASPWISLGIGVGVIVISAILAFFSKENYSKNILCFSLSAIAMGFCIRAWYLFRGFDNGFWTLFLVTASCVVYLLIYYFLLYIPLFHRHINAYTALFVIATLILYIYFLVTTKTTYLSTLGYYLIVDVCFLFALCKDTDRFRKLFRHITLSTYGVLLVAVIIAALMLDGDLPLDGIDTFWDLDSPKKSKVYLDS